MRRILIDEKVKKIARKYAMNLFKKRADNFEKPLTRLKKLSESLCKKEQVPYKLYVDNIISFYDEIILLKPNEFEKFKKEKFNMLKDNQLSVLIPGFPKAKKFYEAVVDSMRYDEVQKAEIRPYMKELGLNTCVYCNASYAVATDDRKATFQVDHWLPKSEYPFLCISFFNLYPACMHCNQLKSKKTTCNFCLYTDNSDLLDPFKFSIDDKSIIKYMLFNNADLLKVNLKSDKFPKDAEEHFNSFYLGGLYSQFSDEIEEIVWKAKIYNESYRNQLLAAYNKNFPFNMHAFKRFYLGFYPDAKDVHKRPLTLLKQSIAKEMGLE
jgi:hypothetical protein bfra3_06232